MIRVVEESKPGKRAAMYTGLAYVDTDITVFADDDALYGKRWKGGGESERGRRHWLCFLCWSSV